MPLSPAEIDAAATDIVAALGARRSMNLLSARHADLSIPDAYRISRAVTALRTARGDRAVGRKIGFTNRTIWDEYGVHHPIDGPMYASTVRDVAGVTEDVFLSDFVEPRIEPEIVFGLASAPDAAMDDAAILGCIGWMAHGFEIVQSLFPGWKFTGADCIAAFGLHGALLCGPRRKIGAAERPALLAALADFSIELDLDGARAHAGHARNVLGGPVPALGHLVRAIAVDAEAAPLRAGDIITTGTLTRAFPLSPGQRWTTILTGLDLPGMDVSFTI